MILSSTYDLPIYNLEIAKGRVYVVSSPDLVLSLQQQPKTVSFWFIEGKFTAILGGMSTDATDRDAYNYSISYISYNYYII